MISVTTHAVRMFFGPERQRLTYAVVKTCMTLRSTYAVVEKYIREGRSNNADYNIHLFR